MLDPDAIKNHLCSCPSSSRLHIMYIYYVTQTIDEQHFLELNLLLFKLTRFRMNNRDILFYFILFSIIYTYINFISSLCSWQLSVSLYFFFGNLSIQILKLVEMQQWNNRENNGIDSQLKWIKKMSYFQTLSYECFDRI